MSNLLSLTYWFQIQPPMFLGWIATLLLVVFTVFVIVGIVVRVYSVKSGLEKYVKRAVDKAGSLLLDMGLAGLLFYFCTYERIPILSMRIWMIVWLGIFLVWVWSIYKYVKIEIPRVESLRQARERMEKWLPKAKK